MKTPTISDPRIFYITHHYGESEIEENPLAQGFTATPLADMNNWGVISWFDKIDNYMRTVEVKAEPELSNSTYTAITNSEGTYFFRAVDKHIYDTCLRLLIPSLPQLPDDASIQKYLRDLTPYL